MKKSFKIILVSLIAGIILLLSLLTKWYLKDKEILSQCPDYKEINQELKKFKGIGPGMVDIPLLINCLNSIVIYKNLEKDVFKYRIFDFKNNYDIAYFNNLNKYKVLGIFLYVINENSEKKYVMDYRIFMDGKLKELSYEDGSIFYRYRKINTQTGEVLVYKNIIEIPESDNVIFSQLESQE